MWWKFLIHPWRHSWKSNFKFVNDSSEVCNNKWTTLIAFRYQHLRSIYENLIFNFFASCYSFCTTVAWVTSRCGTKFLDEVGSTVFNRDLCWVFAKRGESERVGCHNTVQGIRIPMSCVLCFDWLHSGLSNNGKDRLRRKMIILKAL